MVPPKKPAGPRKNKTRKSRAKSTRRKSSKAGRKSKASSASGALATKIGRLLKPVKKIVKTVSFKQVVALLVGLSILLISYTVYLDLQIRSRFEGRLWSVPSKVYARPVVLHVGLKLSADNFEYELNAMRYEKVSQFPQKQGEYRRWQNHFELISRPFDDGFGKEKSHSIRVVFSNKDSAISQRVEAIEHLFSNEPIDLVRLDPALVASIFPVSAEDRLLLKLQDVPDRLIKTLLAVEDRSFFEHAGINPLAIGRAMLANFRAGERVQGGSTITQQLIKNMFLSAKKSYWRKINEAIMALLIEWHYEKHAILEAYLNEVYLGQNRESAIHGFERASEFYFNKSLVKLSTHEIALLIGLIKGPSYYNPWKHPQRAIKRRRVVLEVMRDQGVISEAHFNRYAQRGLDIVHQSRRTKPEYPAFIGLVKKQLAEQYLIDNLSQRGLQIFTTLDLPTQRIANRVVRNARLLSGNKKNQPVNQVELQTAVVVTDISGAAVTAVVGDKSPEFNGFNRAIDAQRQIGSLIKPAIYLAALEQTDKYHLASLLSDRKLSLKMRDGQIWQPENYDKLFRGDVLLFDALVNSYNIPSVRLGLDIGLPVIAKTLRALGIEKEIPVYPSMLLGAFEFSPVEIAQMYQTIAAGGEYRPLQAIRSVLSQDEQLLVQNLKTSERVISKNSAYLLKYMMHQITQTGTAKSLQNYPLQVAGKTGTTDDLRDSWFAGFSKNKLALVWLGNDDNQPTGLTGASGALTIWSNLFSQLPADDINLSPPGDIEMIKVDRINGLRARFLCDNDVVLPFVKSSRPVEYSDCSY